MNIDNEIQKFYKQCLLRNWKIISTNNKFGVYYINLLCPDCKLEFCYTHRLEPLNHKKK